MFEDVEPSATAPGPAPAPLPALPAFDVVGIKDIGTAAGVSGKCIFCDSDFAPGSVYLRFRTKRGKTMKDLRRLHLECAGRMPPDPDHVRVLEALKLSKPDFSDSIDAAIRLLS